MEKIAERVATRFGITYRLDSIEEVNIYMAVASEMRRIYRKQFTRDDETQFLAFLNTDGQYGSIPEYISKRVYEDLLKAVLIKPPPGVTGLPDTPKDRLKLFRFLVPRKW